MNKPVSTIGIALKYGATAAAVSTQLYSITNVPDMEGAPEQIDVTTLADSSRKYMPGVKANDALEFEGIKGKFGAEDAQDADLVDEFATLKALPATNALYWELAYPDGSKHTWQGYPSARSSGSEVNGAATYVLSITPISDIAFTAASGA